MDYLKKAAFFDLDGVVFDTEPQYTEFWHGVCHRYHPEREGLEFAIKGTTLQQCFDQLFSGPLEAERATVTQLLNDFERQMAFPYVAGFPDFVDALRRKGVKTAIVTSSNQAKMANVYKSHPDFAAHFDAILTAEDFARSKPHPDCYLRAAELLSEEVESCVVFEDSFNGIRSGRDAGMTVVGLATSNSMSALRPLCHHVVGDFSAPGAEEILALFGSGQPA